MTENDPAETVQCAPVALNTYRDTVQSCPDLPPDHRALALFLAWKSGAQKTPRGNEVHVVSTAPAQLAKEFGVGLTKLKTMRQDLVRNGWLREHARASHVLTVPPLYHDPDLMIERHYEWVPMARMTNGWKKAGASAAREETKRRGLERMKGSVAPSGRIGRPLRPDEVAPSGFDQSPPPAFDQSPPPAASVAPSGLRLGASYMPTPEGGPSPVPRPTGGGAARLGRRGTPCPAPAATGAVADLRGVNSGDDHRTSAFGQVAEVVPQAEDARAREPWPDDVTQVGPRTDTELWRDVAIGLPLQSQEEMDRYQEMTKRPFAPAPF